MTDSHQTVTAGSKALAILVYTLLRVGLFVVVWLLIELLTPIYGVWALVAAILVSGAISIVVLDRQRGAVGSVAAGFFGRLNARIEASARAEDDDNGDDSSSGQPESQSEDQAVGQQEDAGPLQGRDQLRSERAASDDS